MIRHWWQSLLFLLIPSLKIVFNKKHEVKNWHCRLKRRSGEKSTDFMYFPVFPLKAELSVSKYCLSLTCARNLWLLIYTSLEIFWSPKGIKRHQTLGFRNFEKGLLASSYLSACLSVCPSVCLSTRFHGITRLPSEGVSRNLKFEYFSKICQWN
jgi:hypothetical protein